MERTKLVRRQHHHAYHSIPAQSEQIGSRYKACLVTSPLAELCQKAVSEHQSGVNHVLSVILYRSPQGPFLVQNTVLYIMIQIKTPR